MYHLIRNLPDSALVLDLGSGTGSFSYDATRATVCSIDLLIPARKPGGYFLRGSADALPFSDQSVDVVICNHTLEHFANISASLREIGRVLKPGGALWAAVPDASTLDDRLYRYLFDGGGHVNQFSFDAFRNLSKAKPMSTRSLSSGFIRALFTSTRRTPTGFDSIRARRLFCPESHPAFCDRLFDG